MPPDYWKIGKKQHFICSNLTLFIAPFFFLSFFLLFFFLFFLFGGDDPSPLKRRPCLLCCVETVYIFTLIYSKLLNGNAKIFSRIVNTVMQDFCIVSDFYARLSVRMWSNLFIIIMISHTRFICFLCNSIYVSFIWLSIIYHFDRQTAFHRCEIYDAHSIRHSVWTSCHSLDRRTAFRQC